MNITAFTFFSSPFFACCLGACPLFLFFDGGIYWYLLVLLSSFLFLSPLYHVVFSSSLSSVLFSSVSFASRYCFYPSFSLLSSFLLQPTTPHTTISLVCFLALHFFPHNSTSTHTVHTWKQADHIIPHNTHSVVLSYPTSSTFLTIIQQVFCHIRPTMITI